MNARLLWLRIWRLLICIAIISVIIWGASKQGQNYYNREAAKQFNAMAAEWHEAEGVPYADHINRWARHEGISARLVAALIKAESSFEPKALSSAGAAGLMQVIPSTWRQVNSELKVCSGRHAGECGYNCYFDPELNIRIGTAYLGQMIKRFNGNIFFALAAYNAGPGAVERHRGIPPFEETRSYIERIIGYWYSFGRLTMPVYGMLRAFEQLESVAGWMFFGSVVMAMVAMRRLVSIYGSWRWH